MDTPQAIRDAIIAHHQTGLYTQKKIGDMLHRSRSTIRNIIKNFHRNGTSSVQRKGQCGRKRLLSTRDQRAIARVSQANPCFTAREVQAEAGGNAAAVSIDTIKRSLRRSGLKSYRPSASPCWTAAQRAARLRWCREHQHWSQDQWRKVIFSDETYFDLQKSVNSQFVRREANARVTTAHTRNRRPFLQRALFWGCFSGDQGQGPLVFVDGTMKTATYKYTLQHHLLPFWQQHRPRAGVIFQHDNAPCHKSSATQAFLTENRIRVLQWPAYSPDLNPIENMWGILKRKIHRQIYGSKEELRAAVEQAWQDPSVSLVCQKLSDSMCERISACISAKGGFISY